MDPATADMEDVRRLAELATGDPAEAQRIKMDFYGRKLEAAVRANLRKK